MVTSLDKTLISLGERLEKQFRQGAENGEPQYKYLTVPVYKFCAERIGRAAAAGVSFLAADLVLHQFAPQAAFCLLKSGLRVITPDSLESYIGVDQPCTFSFFYKATLYWACVAFPVVYVKYRRSKE